MFPSNNPTFPPPKPYLSYFPSAIIKTSKQMQGLKQFQKSLRFRRINSSLSHVSSPIKCYSTSNPWYSKDQYSDLTPEQRQLLERIKNRKKKEGSFSVDRSGLVKNRDHYLAPVNPHSRFGKEKLTPLALDLYELINLKGPITIHEYMSQTLNHNIHGYYQQKDNSQIGEEGDFITSPEISQLFGEMIGIWIYNTWVSLGSPAKFDLTELGPGKGTLMVDILRVLSKQPDCLKALQVQFVELSTNLRKVQWKNLQQFSAESSGSLKTTSTEDNNEKEVAIADLKPLSLSFRNSSHSVPFTWSSFFNQLPQQTNPPIPCIIIGQEFLDAFPIHQFVYMKDGGWREKLVDIDRDADSVEEIMSLPVEENPHHSIPIGGGDSTEPQPKLPSMNPINSPLSSGLSTHPYHFRFALSPGTTPAVLSFISSEQKKIKELIKEKKEKAPPSLINLARPTPLMFKKKMEEVRGIKREGNVEEGKEDEEEEENPLQPGDGLEISPLALSHCEDIANRITKCSGAALIIDYGEDFVQQDTLRGYKKHKLVNVLSEVSFVFTFSSFSFIDNVLFNSLEQSMSRPM
jgi:SAM-dependent MidA family methyltransferase